MRARVLVVDDSVTIQKAVELALNRAGVDLIQARSAEEALRKVREERPDLMLIDHSMPDQSGQELCATFRKDPQLNDVPIIMMGPALQPLSESEVRQVGANDVVTKPFESQTLIGKVKQLIGAPVSFGAAGEPSQAPPVEEEAVLGARTVPEETAFGLEPSQEFGEEMRLPADLTEETPLEVGARDLSDEPLPTYDLPVTESEELTMQSVTSEEALSVQTPEGEDVGIEEMAAAVGYELPGTESRREHVEERVSRPSTAHESPPTPAGAPAMAVSPELVETMAREVAERVATHIVRELRGELLDKVDRLLWEVVPDLAEQLLTQEIQRIRDLVEGKQ